MDTSLVLNPLSHDGNPEKEDLFSDKLIFGLRTDIQSFISLSLPPPPLFLSLHLYHFFSLKEEWFLDEYT